MQITNDFHTTALCVPIQITPELKDVNGICWSFESKSKQHFIKLGKEPAKVIIGELLLSDETSGVFLITDRESIKLYVELFCI